MPTDTEATRVDLLAGIRVLDLAEGRGEMCGRYLADLGADVLRVEPRGGAASRRTAPLHDGVSLYFATHNANKRMTALDLDDPSGRDRVLELLGDAEILIEAFGPDGLGDSGLPIADLRHRFPQLVIVSISDFGLDGPYRDYIGNDWVHLAMGAVLARSGEPGRAPLMPPAELAGAVLSVQAAWAAVSAYWNRLVTGAGSHLDLSSHEAVLQLLDPAFGTGGTAGAGRSWHDLPHGRPDTGHYYPVLPCADGFVRIAVLSPRQWHGMRAWLGDPEEFMDPVYDLVHKRFESVDRLYPLIRALFIDQTAVDLVAEGQRRGVPIAPVLTPSAVLAADHYAERGAIAEREVAPGLHARVPTGFVEVDGVRAGISFPAGDVDEHPVTWLPRDTEPSQQLLDATPQRPLTGLRVLDLGVIVLGAEAGRLFADLGAEVIKVENRAFPDTGRTAAGGEMTTSFAWGNRNKLGLGVNLRDPRGVEVFRRLVARADLVLSNFKPGTLESLGLGYDTLRAINPRIVVASSSAVGHTGPWRTWMGYGPLVRAAAGLTSLWREAPDSESFSDSVTVFPDHYAARVIAVAALAGIIRARRTGIGAHVQSSQAEAILTAFSHRFLQESLQPGSFVPQGNRGPSAAPWAVLRCAGDDQWCVVTVRDDADWRALSTAIDAAELLDDPRFATAAARLVNAEAAEEILATWTQKHSPREVMRVLQAVGVQCGAMIRPAELGTDPHLLARHYWATLLQPGVVDALPAEARSWASRDLLDPEQRPAPFHGEHTRDLGARLLGLDDTDLGELIAAGVLEEPDPWRRFRRRRR